MTAWTMLELGKVMTLVGVLGGNTSSRINFCYLQSDGSRVANVNCILYSDGNIYIVNSNPAVVLPKPYIVTIDYID